MQLENNRYLVKFINEGAQFISVFDKILKLEYMHDGKTSWGQHNPTLFPIVGKLYNNSTIINGQTFQMNQHGLVRRADFKVIEETYEKVSFEYISDEEDYQHFPFKFSMIKSYELRENELVINHRIYNLDDKVMPFGLGHHPAFKIHGEMHDYHISFEQEGELQLMDFGKNGGFTHKVEIIPWSDQQTLDLPFDNETHPTLIYKNLKSSFVTLTNNEHGVKISVVGYPYFAVWFTPEQNLVCLEPWLTHGEYEDSTRNFTEMEGVINLSPKKTFFNSYSIKFF